MVDQELVERVWKQRIAPQLGHPPEADLTLAPDGFGTAVHFVHFEQGDFVLRIYPPSSQSRLRNYLQAKRFLSQIGFRVPATLGQGREEVDWLLEEKIAGESFRHLLDNPDAVAKAATALAELHGHERGRYGEVGTWGGFRLTLRWRQRFPERWEKIERLFPELKPFREEVAAWFRDWTDSFSTTRYQLLHGDYHPGNLSLLPNGEIAFLDLRTPRYGFGLLEVMEAVHHFTGEEEENWSWFLHPYLGSRNGDTRRLYETFSVSLHAVFHLRHADRFADLAVGDRGTREVRQKWERNAWDSWLRFSSLAGIDSPALEISPETPFPTRSLSLNA